MLIGEIRHQPEMESTLYWHPLSSCSRVVLLRSETSTFCRPSSSMAWPANVIGLPGATTRGDAAVGGFMIAGALMFTDGATPDELTIQVRDTLSSADWPVVSTARAWARH